MSPPRTDAPEPRIRAAEPRDAAAIAGLLGELGYPASPEQVAARLARLRAHEPLSILVAELGDRVVGCATLHLIPVLHEDQPRAQLTALVVGGAARRRGVGRALVRRVESLAVERGARSLVVTTANHREATHVFYEGLSFEWTGRRYAKRLG